MLATWGGGAFLITTDGGSHWDSSKITINNNLDSQFGALFFFNSSEGLAFNQFTWSTSNGGYTWEKRDTNTLLTGVENTAFADKNVGWVVCIYNPWGTDAGIIAKTTDGGNLWFYQGDTINNMIYDYIMFGVDCLDSNNAFAVGTNLWFRSGFFYSTTNGGTKWNIKNFYGSGPFYDVGFYDLNVGWIAGCCGKILQTTDKGETWTTYNTGINANLKNVVVLRNENVAYVMGEANMLYRIDIVMSVHDEVTIPTQLILSQNYPNPFNPKTKIIYLIPYQSHVTLKIFDIYGRDVTTLVDEYKTSGKYEIDWDAKGVSNGIYFIRLTANNYSQTKKALLLK